MHLGEGRLWLQVYTTEKLIRPFVRKTVSAIRITAERASK